MSDQTLKTILAAENKSNPAFAAIVSNFKKLGAAIREAAAEQSKLGNKSGADALRSLGSAIDKMGKDAKGGAANLATLQNAMKGTESSSDKLANKTKFLSEAHAHYEKTLKGVAGAEKLAIQYANQQYKALADVTKSIGDAGGAAGSWAKKMQFSNWMAEQNAGSLKILNGRVVEFTKASQDSLGLSEKNQKALSNYNGAMSVHSNLLNKASGHSKSYQTALSGVSDSIKGNNTTMAQWGAHLLNAEKNVGILSEQFRGQKALINGQSQDLGKLVSQLNLAGIATSALEGNTKLSSKSMGLMNEKALAAAGISHELASKLGLIGKGYTNVELKTQNLQRAYAHLNSVLPQSEKFVQNVNTAFKNGTITQDNAVRQLNRYRLQQQAIVQESSKLGKVLEFIGGRFKSFAAYTLAAATVSSTLATVFKLLSSNIEYSQALKDVEAITRATADEMVKLDEKIRDVAGSTKFSAIEIAEGMKLLGQSGFSAQESMQAIEAVSNLATGTLSSMATSTELVTTAIRVFGKDASDAAEITDIFTNAVNTSKLTVDKIKIALNYIGPVAQRAGVSLEDTSAAMMVLANSGLRASSMATGLRRVFKELTVPSEKMKEAIRLSGLEIEDFDLRANSMRTIVKNLGHVVTDADKAFELFGLRGATAASALVTQGVPAFDKMREAVSRQGTAAENSRIQLEGLGILFKQIGDKAYNLALAFGDAGLNGALRVFALTLRGVLDGLTAIVGNPITQWTVKLTGAIAAFIALQWALKVNLMGTAFTYLTGTVSKAVVALKALNLTFLGNPIGLVIAGITAVIALYIAFHKSTEEVIRDQEKLRQDSLKAADALTQEIEAIKNFNETAAKKLEMLNGLAEKYPKFAIEIYNTKGNAEDLVAVLEKMQKIKLDEAVDASKVKLKSLSDQLKDTTDKVNGYQDVIDGMIIQGPLYGGIVTGLNKSLEEQDTIIGQIVTELSRLEQAGVDYNLDEILAASGDSAGVLKEQIIEALASQKEMNKEANKDPRPKKEKEILATTIENLQKKKEVAAVEAEQAEYARQDAEIRLGLLQKFGATQSEINVAENEFSELEKLSVEARTDLSRITKQLLENQKSLVSLKIAEHEIEIQLAKIGGGERVEKIAEENKAYQERLKYINDTLLAEKEAGREGLEIYQRLLAARETSRKTHEENLQNLQKDFAKEDEIIATESQTALLAIDLETVDQIKQSKLDILEAEKQANLQEVADNQAKFLTLTNMEGDHADEILELLELIKKGRKTAFDIELKLIKEKEAALLKIYDLEIQMATISGDERAQKIAEINKAYQEQVNYINNALTEEKRANGESSELYQRLLATKATAAKNHNQELLDANKQFAEEDELIKRESANALAAVELENVEKIKLSKLGRLEQDKQNNLQEIADAQAKLLTLQNMEGEHSAEIIKLIELIRKKRENVSKIELDSIKERTAASNKSYAQELANLDAVLRKALFVIQERRDRGLISAADYEYQQNTIVLSGLKDRLAAAEENVTRINAIEGSSDEDRKNAILERDNLKQDVHEAESQRTTVIIQQDKEVADKRREEEQRRKDAVAEQLRLEEEANEKRKASIAGLASWVAGMYDQMYEALAEVSSNALGMVNKNLGDALVSAREGTTELGKWGLQLEGARQNLENFKNAALTSFGTWSGMYLDLADKWRQVAAAIGEKLNYLKTMEKLQKTEITDTTDLIGLETALNQIKARGDYLGKEDVQNIKNAKAALQELINAERLRRAEKETERLKEISAKLEEARSYGVDLAEYGFDEKGAARLKAIEKENAVIQVGLAEREYQLALELDALEKRGAKEEEIAAFRKSAEEELATFREDQALLNLESSAITSRLNLEKMNLEIINDLKIKQYEEELAREEALHQTKLDNIEKENAEKMKPYENGLNLGALQTDALQPIKRASGGRIPGESTIDSVPVLARPGEWFIRNESARHWTNKFGEGFMNGINKPLSAAGRTISSALQNIPAPMMSVPVSTPKVAFATGGKVQSYSSDESGILNALRDIKNALSSNTKESPAIGRSVTVNLTSGGTKVSGSFREQDAKNFLKMLQDNQMVTG